jgi:hypothetical protein
VPKNMTLAVVESKDGDKPILVSGFPSRQPHSTRQRWDPSAYLVVGDADVNASSSLPGSSWITGCFCASIMLVVAWLYGRARFKNLVRNSTKVRGDLIFYFSTDTRRALTRAL